MQASPHFKLGLQALKFSLKALAYSFLIFWLLFFFRVSPDAAAGEFAKLKGLIAHNDSLVVANPAGQILVSKNKNKKLIPASILKIFTSLVAFHYLGPDYHYPTEIYLDRQFNLKIKGSGDPLLVSEIVREISRHIATLIGDIRVLRNLIVDDSFFNRPLTIPGISSSSQPYDAPNGALCVNFNTVFFTRTKSGYVSAESQTPLLPFAEKKIKALKLKSGRFVLSHLQNENTVYAGKLFQYFLKQEGVQFSGEVKPGRVNKAEDKLIYRYISRFSVAQIISKLLEHSNNFITNQLLISSGIKLFGPPGNLDKGISAARDYAASVLRIKKISIVEGSGISRKNRISAHQMLEVLKKFKPHHGLLRAKDREYYKTGTLHGINTRAGYIVGKDKGLFPYVVMVNTAGKSTKPIMRKVRQILK